MVNTEEVGAAEGETKTKKQKTKSKEESQSSSSHVDRSRSDTHSKTDDDIHITEFRWCWWDGKAPCCPFCAVLMLPIT